MKNLQILPEKSDVIDHCQALWQSDIFRHSMNTGGYVWRLVDHFSNVGRVFAQMTDPTRERAHFSAWWNVFPYREYGNPVLNDLYWVHEMSHAIWMPHRRNMPFEAWQEKMNVNEYEASVESEIWIYTQIPGLRAQSFGHPIWADRFLTLPPSREAIYADRLRATHAPEDPIEEAMATFVSQNDAWAAIWKPRYNVVEELMCDFESASRHSRTEALYRHVERLTSIAKSDGAPYPFAPEAEAFARIYWANTATRSSLVTQG